MVRPLLPACSQGEADVRISFRRTVQLPAVALALGVWGAWTPAGTSEPNVAVDVNGDAITHDDIERRAQLLGLSANVTEQAKLLKSGGVEERLKALQHEVVTNNPGKTREELIAIIKERQAEIGKALQKKAVEAARDSVMPKLWKDAREELIDERLKLQAAKKGGIEISDADAKASVQTLADRNNMTYEQFAQHLKGKGIDIATMVEKYRVQEAWRELLKRK